MASMRICLNKESLLLLLLFLFLLHLLLLLVSLLLFLFLILFFAIGLRLEELGKNRSGGLIALLGDFFFGLLVELGKDVLVCDAFHGDKSRHLVGLFLTEDLGEYGTGLSAGGNSVTVFVVLVEICLDLLVGEML